jgi:hypothetical protein
VSTAYVVAVLPDRGGSVDYLGPATGSLRSLVGTIEEADRFGSEHSAEVWAKHCRKGWIGVHHAVEVRELHRPWWSRALTWASLWLRGGWWPYDIPKGRPSPTGTLPWTP